jgi:hypothetical protein
MRGVPESAGTGSKNTIVKRGTGHGDNGAGDTGGI